MREAEVIYRPPFEAGSFLLEVTKGCSHNACSFCTIYKAVHFRVLSDEKIEAQLVEVQPWANQITRVFLENGDPFALHADKLSHIADLIHQYLPMVETIAMYASVKNIEGKSDTELASLRQAGINELNIGVESGLDSALMQMNKGYTAMQAQYELQRLTAAGMDWGANIIFGCAGAGHGEENAEATAALLNTTKPYLIFTGTMHADPGCPLYDDLQKGKFEEPTIGEYLLEEERFLQQVDLEGCYYFGLHPSNVVPKQGMLNRDKEMLLRKCTEARIKYRHHLDDQPIRGSEGAIMPWKE